MTAVDRPDNGQDEGSWRVTNLVARDTGETLVTDGDLVVGYFHRNQDAELAVAAVNAARAGAGEQQLALLEAARGWIWRHSSQPDGDRWRDNPDHLDWAAQNLLIDLAPWLAHTDEPQLATCSDRHRIGDLTMYCEQIPRHVGPHVNHRTYW